VPPLPEEMASLLPAFEILRILGRGGMGAVYLGRDRKLDRLVAIKLLPPELSMEAAYVDRFMREAKALAKLDHQNIVHIYAFDQTPAGHLYFVMEYVDGMDLHRLMHRAPDAAPPGPGASTLSYSTTLEIIGGICDALQYAHDKGIIHRDIKPANVLIAADGRVKVADFGLARPAEARKDDSVPMTQTGTVMGTPDYMAPEQREGHPADHRADIYALGVMFYEMLTGSIPRGAFPPPSRRVKVDVRLDEIVLKALQSEPDLRYQRASQIKTDVARIQTTSPARSTRNQPSYTDASQPPGVDSGDISPPPETPKAFPSVAKKTSRPDVAAAVGNKGLFGRSAVKMPRLTDLPPRIRPGAVDDDASQPPPSKPFGARSKLWLVAGVMALLAGSWWAFTPRGKPEVLAQSGDWTGVEGGDTEFEIKFRNADRIFFKNGTLPEDLYLDDTVNDYGDGLKSQTVRGSTQKTGVHQFSVVAGTDGQSGVRSPPATFRFAILAEEVRDTSGGKLRELSVDRPLVSGIQELVRGCVRVTPQWLDGSGLTVKTDVVRRVAFLEGTPVKEGEIKFTVKAESADGRTQTFAYSVTVRPKEPPPDSPVKPVIVAATEPAPKPAPGTATDPEPISKPEPPPEVRRIPDTSLDPAILALLNDRIEKSRIEATEKVAMRAAVNQIHAARRIGDVKFPHRGMSVSPADRTRLRGMVLATPGMETGEARSAWDFIVVGYSSSRGRLVENIALSKARAATVAGVLKDDLAIEPAFTGDYGATNALGNSEDANRVVEIYAIQIKSETRPVLQRLVDNMKRISGAPPRN
jgi:serine/threonine protein kinase/outer membrane protein OmpA-like peptidoglycan-associated protein